MDHPQDNHVGPFYYLIYYFDYFVYLFWQYQNQLLFKQPLVIGKESLYVKLGYRMKIMAVHVI